MGDLCRTYYDRQERTDNNAIIVDKYLTGASNDLEENARMGYVSALGALPRFMAQPNLENILVMLIKQSLIPSVQQLVLSDVDRLPVNHVSNGWSEARRDSVKALSIIVHTMGFAEDDPDSMVHSKYMSKVFQCLLLALEEYTIDDRGDIGAWVREASMNGMF